jgi:prepilin-type N-terminal cleavage/methylation domain-containing protein
MRLPKRSRGYTVIELMMALAVFTTGVMGVIAMQRTVLAANRHARNLTVANGIAQAWLDQLAVDSTMWVTNLNDTVWLQSVNAPGVNGTWQLPAQSVAAVRNFGPTFNVFGAPDPNATDYCAHIRLTWFSDPNAGAPAGTGSIRTEVRVFWLRDGGTRVAADCTGQGAGTINAITADANGTETGATTNDDYFFVYQASAVAQRP